MKITVTTPMWSHGVTFEVSERDFNSVVSTLVLADAKSGVEKLKDDLPKLECAKVQS